MTIELRAELAMADLGRVPPGAVLEDGYSRKVTVLDNGYAVMQDGGASYPLYSLRGWRFTSLPEEAVLPRYNIEVFKQMARTVCFGFAHAHGVAREPVLRALDRIGANDERPPLGVGMYVHYSDTDLRSRILRKGGVLLGHGNPNQWEAYGEFRDLDGSRPTMGGVSYYSQCMRVLAMNTPDTEQWLRPPNEEDDAEVARMRGVMWEIGVRAKRANSWCEAYETAMSVLGITSASVTEVTAREPEVAELGHIDAVVKPVDDLPTVSNDTQAEEYPVGAIFEYPGAPMDLTRSPDYTDRNTSWCWQRRTQGHGMEGSVNLIGPNGGRYGGDRRVLYDGRGEMLIPVYRDLLPHLPIGTLVRTRAGDYWWKKVRHTPGDNEWARSNREGRVTGTAEVRNDGFTNRNGDSSWFVGHLPDTTQHGANNTYPDGRPYPDQNPF